MGGYDIFRSVLDNTTGQWTEPENLDFAFNSADDDFMFVTDQEEVSAYFASNRVNEFGEVTDESVLKSAHPDLDESALAALECIPQMVPGSQQGKPVRVTYTIPVRFTIR